MSMISLRALSGASSVTSAASAGATSERVTFHTVRGNMMAVREWGPADGPVLLGVTGLSANSICFADLAVKAAALGYHVVVPDLRGRNLSPATGPFSYGHENHALDIQALAKTFTAKAKDKGVILVGHSMGGLISMHVARLMPAQVKKVVLLDVLGVPEAGAISAISHSVDRFDKDYASPEEYVALQRKSGVIHPFTDTWRRHYAEELEKQPNGRYKARTTRDAILEDTASAATQFPQWYWSFLPNDTLLLKAGVPLAPVLGNVVSDLDTTLIRAVKPGFKVATITTNHYSILTDPSSVKAVCQFIGKP